MKHILIIFIPILILASILYGQSSKPLGVVLPPIVKGNVSETRKQFLLNTLYDELSKYFDFSPLPQIESGDCLVGCDVFQLQIIEEDGDTQLSLRWMSENYRRIETKLCVGCKTIELDAKLRKLVGKLVDRKKKEGEENEYMSHLVYYWCIRRTQYITSIGLFYKEMGRLWSSLNLNLFKDCKYKFCE